MGTVDAPAGVPARTLPPRPEDPAVQTDFPKPFRCSIAERDGTTHIRPAGELDMSSVPQLESSLRAALEGGARRLVVDLRGLDFMDSTGLTLLTRWQRESRRDGFELALVRGDHRIHRLFELTAMEPLFTFVER
jgi:anti-sigma B factor antagonist